MRLLARKRIGRSWGSAVESIAGRRRLFEQMVADALDDLPEEFQRQLNNVEVVIDDGGWDTLGLYQGIPQTERGGDYTGVLPDVITIYRAPIEARCPDEASLRREVRITVLHEIGHHFGIDDERLTELGWD